jgi:hypothetical protein
MATSSYSNLFGTNGSGQTGSQAGIGTMFGQQPKRKSPYGQFGEQGQQQPSQTFAQLQQQGMARPAPQAPQAKPFAQFGGSEQAQQARTGMLGQLQQQLAQPTRFDTQAFQQIRGAQAANLQAEYGAEQSRLNEELARRGLSASSIGGGRMGDLAGQQARALSSLDAQLLQQAAQTQAQDRLAAMQAAGQFAELAGSQDLAQFEANRVAQAAEFQQGLQGAQFQQGQREFDRSQALAAAQAQQAGGQSAMELELRRQLGLGELTGQVGGQQTLAARQQAEQTRQFDIQQDLQRQLGLGGLGIQERELGLRAQQLQQEAQLQGRSLSIEEARLAAQQEQFGQQLGFSREQLAQQATDAQAERALRTTMQTRELTAQESQQLRDIEARKTLQTAQFTQESAEAKLERDLREKLQKGQITAQETQQLNEITARKELQTQQLAQQRELAVAEITGTIGVPGPNGQVQQVSTLAAQRLGQEGMQLKLQQAAQLAQQTGNVYELDADGNVVVKTTTDAQGNPVPVRTESALARLSQERIAQGELTGEITIDGVTVPTMAAKQLTQQQLDALRDQALRQSQVTGVMYKISADGKGIEPETVNGQAVTTESRRAQQEQERNQRTQIATQQAESLSQQTGLAYRVNPATGAVEAITDPANPQRQLTTVEAQRLSAQTEQSNLDRALRETLGMGELTGMVGGQQTIGARTAQQNLLVQLASALAGSEKGVPSDVLNQLYTILGLRPPGAGGGLFGGGGAGGGAGGGGGGGGAGGGNEAGTFF